MENISEHISYEEGMNSQTATRLGIDNTPTLDILLNMKLAAKEIFEPLRKLVSDKRGVDSPINISSFYRCPKLNTAIGGADNSQHCLGEAMDLECFYPGFGKRELFEMAKENLPFDQMILEFKDSTGKLPAWVHISYSERNRKQILIATNNNGLVKYLEYTPELAKEIYGWE